VWRKKTPLHSKRELVLVGETVVVSVLLTGKPFGTRQRGDFLDVSRDF
jgi:hypothetical protein